MRIVTAAFFVLVSTAAAQTSSIQVRKVRTLEDRDGKGFARAPVFMVPLAGGQYALQEVNELPMIVDSTGRLIKRFGRGGGPGELEFNGTSMSIGPDGLLYVGNQGSYNVYGLDGRFVRSVPLNSIYAGPLIPVRGGLLVNANKQEPQAHQTFLHLLDSNGRILRSFVRDTFDRKMWPPLSHHVSPAADGNLWVVEMYRHRIEKWSLDGKRLMVAEPRSQWFDVDRSNMDGKPVVKAVRESDGVLWVMSSVPVANYRAIMTRVVGVGREVDGRQVPSETLGTAWLEAYDAKSGKKLAEVSLKRFGVALLPSSQYVVYGENAVGAAQLEVWEMKLRR